MQTTEDRQIRMFGCTTEEVIAGYVNAFNGTLYIMGILSDAQECIERGMNETARQYINKAKFLLAEHRENEA